MLAGGNGTAVWSAAADRVERPRPGRFATAIAAAIERADFQSRIRMLSENLRLHEALAKLDCERRAGARRSGRRAGQLACLAALLARGRRSRSIGCGPPSPPHPRPGCARPGCCAWQLRSLHQNRPLEAAALLSGGAEPPRPGRASQHRTGGSRFPRRGDRRLARAPAVFDQGTARPGASQPRLARAASRARRPVVRHEGPVGRLYGSDRSPFPADTRAHGRPPAALWPSRQCATSP